MDLRHHGLRLRLLPHQYPCLHLRLHPRDSHVGHDANGHRQVRRPAGVRLRQRGV